MTSHMTLSASPYMIPKLKECIAYRLNNMSFTIIIRVISPEFVKAGSSKEDDIRHQLRTLMQDFQCLQIDKS